MRALLWLAVVPVVLVLGVIIVVACVLAGLAWLCQPFAGARRCGIVPPAKHVDSAHEDFKPLPPGPPGTLFGLPVVEVDEEHLQRDVVPEGGYVSRHPLGHRTWPLESLTAGERRLWNDVRKRVQP